MDIWRMKTPNFVCSGRSSINNLKELIPKGVKNIFLVVDKNIKEGGFFNNILKQLKAYKSFSFSDFTSDPEKQQITLGADYYKKFNAHCILAVGGGSAIDAAKAIALLGENYSHIDECFEKGNFKKEKFPYFIAIPTTCGTGAESSPYAIIKDKRIHKKNTIEREFFIPDVVILDSDGLNTLSREFKVGTALDTLVHILEVHTSITANSLVRINTRGALISFKESFEKAIFFHDEEALEELQYIAFTARLLYPRTGLSIAHSLAHPLGAYTGLHHGMLVAIIMPEVIRYNKDFNKKYFLEASKLIKDSDKVEDISKWIENILEATGIYKIARNKLIGQVIPIEDICRQAIHSSNIKSNPREVKNVEELINITNKVLNKILNYSKN